MDLAGVKDFLFRHVEKIVLAIAIVFVGYRVYVNLFAPEVVQPGRTGTQPVAAPMPGTELEASFWRTTSPFLRVPSIEAAKYNWFYPPKTHWGRYVEIVEPGENSQGKDTARVPVRRKIVGSPQVTELTQEERAFLRLPEPDKDLTAMCRISVAVAPAVQGEPAGDVLALKATKAGYWARVMVMLENQDRFCVAVIVRPAGTIYETGLTVAKIDEIKEQPLGMVTLRFNAKQGSEKFGERQYTYIEPTYFEVRRKGERDKEEVAIGRVPGRAPQAEGAPGTEVNPLPKPADATGFPGAAKKTLPQPVPPKKGTVPPKGEPARGTGELTFEDQDVEAEVTYTYRIRSVLVPREGEDLKPEEGEKFGPPVIYRTQPRFSFAYLGGDPQRATIRVFIGPRDDPQGWKDFERIPIGGWIGDVPKEFRAGAEPTEAAPPPAPSPAPLPVPGRPVPGKAAPAPAPVPPKAKAPTPAEAAEGPANRFVTRYILVDIEQSVFRPVEQEIRKPGGLDALGKPIIRVIKTYRETQERRAIIKDPKDRLHHLWREELPTAPPEKGK